ncbi:hypothetical protein BIY23_01965 [Wolbachia pipientis]|uniref:OmpH family outer membrane protein n=1 Tax=Wolbachia pipientis TaxID=955 RepID=A0A1E7QJX9_WOLPI|nr:OmpH family outer membrane protein [Wolbachia pipientis]OEY86780.1 hypothetical protein BIY23_01965 [Wolbachia pipientis]
MKNLLILICVLFSSVSLFFSFLKNPEHVSSTESTLAIIDSTKIIKNSLALNNIGQQLKEQSFELEQEFRKEMDKFRLSQEEIDLLSEEAKKEKQEQIERDTSQIRDHYTKRASGLDHNYNDAINSIVNKVKEVIKEVAESEKIDLVFEKNVVWYLKNKIDLSDKVLESINKVMPKFDLKGVK